MKMVCVNVALDIMVHLVIHGPVVVFHQILPLYALLVDSAHHLMFAIAQLDHLVNTVK